VSQSDIRADIRVNITYNRNARMCDICHKIGEIGFFEMDGHMRA